MDLIIAMMIVVFIVGCWAAFFTMVIRKVGKYLNKKDSKEFFSENTCFCEKECGNPLKSIIKFIKDFDKEDGFVCKKLIKKTKDIK